MFPRLLFQGCVSAPPHFEPSSDANTTLDETSTLLKEIDNLMGEILKKILFCMSFFLMCKNEWTLQIALRVFFKSDAVL